MGRAPGRAAVVSAMTKRAVVTLDVFVEIAEVTAGR